MTTNVRFAFIAASMLAITASAAESVKVNDGDRIAFLGDSITQYGNGPVGYVNLVMKGLEVAGVTNAVKIPAGVSGHKSDNMRGRLQKDVLDKHPQWMTLSCGVNDVWHGARGVPLDAYKANISNILDRCAEAGVKVVVLTATMIGEIRTTATTGSSPHTTASSAKRRQPAVSRWPTSTPTCRPC